MTFFNPSFLLYVMKWEVFMKHFCMLWSMMVVSRQNTGMIVWIADWTSHFLNGTSFLFERTTDKPWSFRIEYLAHIFLKRNEISLSLQLKKKKTLTELVASDKTWPFKWKLGVGEICICHVELDGFPRLFNWDLWQVIFWYCVIKCVNICKICKTCIF